MTSTVKFALALAVSSLAIVALGGPIAAQSVEQQCRASVRAELMGPQCRIANPDYDDHCYYHYPAGMTNYVNKVIECINRGGPGHRARDAHR
jgi:hypothetical protein